MSDRTVHADSAHPTPAAGTPASAAHSREVAHRGPVKQSGAKGASTQTGMWYTWSLRRRVFGAFLCVLGAVFFTYFALKTPWGQSVDTLFMEAAIHWSDSLGGMSQLVTSIVSIPAIVAVGILIVIFALMRRRHTLAGRALGVVVGANLTTQAVKWLVERPDLHVTTAISNSLPSGHVTVAISFALALVMVAPRWSRGFAAWLGWAWTSLMGVAVMVAAWHRLADVLVAVLIAGAWALALAPIEEGAHRVPGLRKIMSIFVLVLLGLGVVLTVVALIGQDVLQVANPGAAGFGFSDFVEHEVWRARLLAFSASFFVVGACGAVIHEVDALCVNRS